MIKISFVGDIMCEEEQLLANKTTNSYDFSGIFKKIKATLIESDFLVGNLETPIAGKDLKYTNHKWSFNSPIEFAKSVKDAGFDLVSTANNHCLDRGVNGLHETLRNLDQIKLEHTGTSSSQNKKSNIHIKNISDVKIAFISYTYGTNAAFNKFYLKKSEKNYVNLFKRQEIKINKNDILKRVLSKIEHFIIGGYTLNPRLTDLKRKIKLAKSKADFVFILMHSGGQYNLIPDNWTKKLIHYLLIAEVDGVIGCHPHVVQKVAITKKKQIAAFSLGNFCSYPGSDSCKMNQSEYSIILHLFINEVTKKIDKVTFQISKSVVDNKGIAKIHLLYDLIENENDPIIKKQLIADNFLILRRFLNQKVREVKLKREYILPNFAH